jgi:hypothetical protein
MSTFIGSAPALSANNETDARVRRTILKKDLLFIFKPSIFKSELMS